MRIARGTWTTSVVLLALLLAGCGSGGEDDPPPFSLTPPPDSATVQPTPSTTGPPELPAEAMSQTDNGAMAFVRHWYDLLGYAQTTGDTAPLLAVSASDCVTCQDYVKVTEDMFADGDRYAAPSFVLEAVNAPEPREGRVIVNLVLHQQAVDQIKPGGTPSPVPATTSTGTMALIKWVNDKWQMLGIGQE